MRIIGIDPGLGVCGIGIVEAGRDRCGYLHHGVIRTKTANSTQDRLAAIRDGIRDIAREWHVDGGGVEAAFVGENAKSALALGQARAAALLGLADAGIEAAEYTPTAVKQTVAGYGQGSKAQIAEMVRLQLGMSRAPTPADATDALAIAITHWAHWRHFERVRG